MVERIQALAEQIRASAPDAEVDFTAFPSGSAMVDVRRGGRLFVLAYSPTRHFGVDEVLDGEGFQISYRLTSESLERAAERLRELVAGAAVVSGSNGPLAPCTQERAS
jgi:hypothetical protein